MSNKKPNIVFIFSDQQRYDTLGCYGQELDISPNLDKLAKEGVLFENAFTMQPVCGPARASLQTGKFATEIGCFKNGISLPVYEKTMAHYLKEQGYKVGYVGKWHLASDEQENNYEIKSIPLDRRGGYIDYWMASDVLEFTSNGYGGYVFDKDGNKIMFHGYRVDCITDFAINYIEEQSEEEPFFLFLSHIEPHHQNNMNCYQGPQGSKEKFKNFKTPLDLKEGVGDWEKEYSDYLGCCNSLDENVGRIINKLKEKDLYDNTLIIYTSDHGCHFKTRNRDLKGLGLDDYKRTCFDSASHIPMIIKGMNFNGGKRINKMVSLIDLPKTILNIAGCEIPNSMQGDDLQEVFNEDMNWKDEIFMQISESFVGRAIRSNKYTYCIHAEDKNPWIHSGSDVYTERYLFDLEKDPLEQNNLINDCKYKKVKEELKERIKWWMKKANEGEVKII
ncbi:sulfatase-like hydrolase/transferase [Clostridium tarantellae]|uniref:Sulfatase-like hydrolase/transferase n=1 Tax=Clostridium tarantellae TaxID=39493 RepID=A0A6I1MHX4_9CLOT|nr:sulfatase-like hydrolase/transferase [Clostridium tarantellae]MPQ42740.1 sulfatase-like hydrolase/transferase [Clostridium tarantellae]